MNKTCSVPILALFEPLLLRIAAVADPKIEVMSGYPANCSAWLTIYYQRKSGRWSYEWYDRAGYRRPAALDSAFPCLMLEVNDRGASPQEQAQARRLLSQQAFFEA